MSTDVYMAGARRGLLISSSPPRIAAVWTPNPGHPLTWAGFFAFIVIILGIGTTLIGLLVAYGARGRFRSPRSTPVAPVIMTTGVIVLVGAGITALGLWLY